LNIEDLRINPAPTLVREHALDKLRGAIAAGFYRPGARLVERELCEALGVSRTSVREALRQLQSEGLIEAGSQRSIVVAKLSAEDAYDIYTLRELVETTAIQRFVERDDPKALKRLQSAYKAIEKSASRGDAAALSDMAGAFYELILDGSGSKAIADTGRHLLKRVSYLRLASMSEPHRIEDGLSEWMAIIDAVANKDPKKAAEALALHISNAREAVVSRLLRDNYGRPDSE